MNDEKHQFSVNSVWTGNSNADGVITAGDRTIAYGLPVTFEGKPGRSNPEEMLLGAVASCYSITLAVIAERRRLPMIRIDVEMHGEVVRLPDKTLKFTTIRIVPTVTLENAQEAQRTAAMDAAMRAENYCIISNAVRGNVEITVEPKIVG